MEYERILEDRFLEVVSRKDYEIAQLQSEVSQLEQRLAQVAQDAQSAQSEIAALLNSTSWRITAPLRKMRNSSRNKP